MENNTNKDVIVTPNITTTEDVMKQIEAKGSSAEKAETLCRWAAARGGVIVVAPLLGTGALIANEIYLVTRIAKVYNVKLSEGAIAGFLGAIGASVAGNLLTTLIPLSVIQIPVAVGLTYAVGKVAQAWIEDGMPKDMSKYKPMLEDLMEQAKAQAKDFAADPLKNIPLGDEKKEMLRDRANQAKTIFEEKSELAKEKAELAKDILNAKAEIAREKAEIAKEKAAEAKDKLGEKAEIAKEKAADTKEKLGEKAEEAKGKAVEAKERLSEKADVVKTKVEEKVTDVKGKIQK